VFAETIGILTKRRSMELPKLYTGRYLAESVAEGVERGVLVPVRVSVWPPVATPPYKLKEVAWSLVPSELMLGEWPHLSTSLLDRLDFLGIEKVSGELEQISERHGGRPLILLDHDDMMRGIRSHRIVFSFWWEEQTGFAVPELLGSGETIHHSQVHKQARFERPSPPKPKVDDRRYAHNEYIADWPLTDEDIERWVQSRYFQYARTAPRNPHCYSHRDWGDREMFLRVVMHLREHGEEEVFGRATYTYLDTRDRKLWTMGAVLETTIILNAKLHNPEDMAHLAEEQTGKSREELGLVLYEPEGSGGERPGKKREVEPAEQALFDKKEV
jgi:hypothetical protein